MRKVLLLLIFLHFIFFMLPGIDVYVGPSRTYTTLHDAVNAYPPSTVLNLIVDPGIYTDNIDDPTKRISITGSGNGNDPSEDTIIRQINNNPIIRINVTGTSAERIIFRNFRIETNGNYAFEFPDTVSISYISFDNLVVTGSPSDWGENEIGVKVSTTASVDQIEIADCTFSYLDYAFYFAKHGDWNPSTSNVTNFVMRDSSVVNNDYKGAYIEKLSDALFDNVNISDNGHTNFWNSRWNAGIDINLKGDNYQNLSFTECIFQGNAQSFRDGAALMIKARDDGATYGTYPATLTGVTINGCEFRDNERGIRFGEPDRNNAGPINVVIRDSVITGNVQTYGGNDGSEYGGLINYTGSQTDASYNYWDADCTGPYHAVLNTSGQGDTVFGDVIFNPWRCYSTPTAIIRVDPSTATGIAPFRIRLNGLSSFSPSGIIESYQWDLGDGNVSSDPVLNHVYNSPGNYRVVLIVTDNFGSQDSVDIIVRVVNKEDITAKIWTERGRIKAFGVETTTIFAELYSRGEKLGSRYRVSFVPETGNTIGFVAFDNSLARYSQILRSGIEGIDTIKLYLLNTELGQTYINYIWVQPPSSFSVEIFDDSKIFVKNYAAVLNWSASVENYNEIVLSGYRIYRSFDGIEWLKISELPTSSLKFSDFIKQLPVWYRITSFDNKGYESRGIDIKKDIK